MKADCMGCIDKFGGEEIFASTHMFGNVGKPKVHLTKSMSPLIAVFLVLRDCVAVN